MIAKFVARRRLLLVAAVWMAVAAPVFGQGAAAPAVVAAPVYDVVAIKPDKTGGGMMRINNTADRFSATNVSLKMMIQSAYELQTADLISGLPGWADSARFDIEAKMDEDAAAALQKLPMEERMAQRRSMMEAMLADRFKLKVHRDSKEMPMYALVIAKGGFKLKDADPNSTYANGIKGPDGVSHAGMMMMGNGTLRSQATPISNLLGPLSVQLHRQVVDKTGLTGKYDVALQWAPEDNQGPAAPGAAPAPQPAGPATQAVGPPASSGPSIFTALQEQLGLRLEPIKGPVDTVVVDHVEMPSEN